MLRSVCSALYIAAPGQRLSSSDRSLARAQGLPAECNPSGAVAFGFSAEEKASIAQRLEGEAHEKLRQFSQEAVAKIMHDVSDDLQSNTDEVVSEVLQDSRAVLASELGKLAAEAHTLAAGKLTPYYE